MSKEALTGHKPANTRRPFIAFAHEAGRFYSDPVVEVLTKARDRKKNRLNIMFCRNVKETIHLLASSDIMGTPDVLFIDGRIPNDGFYQDRSPGDTLFYTGTKVYNDVRRENRNLRIVIFTTDHSEATRLSLDHSKDPNLCVILVSVDLQDDINWILLLVKNAVTKKN